MACACNEEPMVTMPARDFDLICDTRHREGVYDGWNDGKWFGFKWGIVEGICIAGLTYEITQLVKEPVTDLYYKIKAKFRKERKEEP